MDGQSGVVWLTIVSPAPGEQGYVTAPQENAYLKKMQAVRRDLNPSKAT
jgi:hypothetical protein